MHLQAARTLIAGKRWQSAYHIAGHAVECGLKACIAKQTRRHVFPPKTARDLYTHDLNALLRLAALDGEQLKESQQSPAFSANWATAKDWTPESRYDLTIPEQSARDIYKAITAQQNGVMRWIRQRW